MTSPFFRVLVVEDDPHKRDQIARVIQSERAEAVLVEAQSVNAAKDRLRDTQFELVVLDMSLPSYSVDAAETGGYPQVFGGRELLSYLDFLDATALVIVITQFDRFDSGIEDITLESLAAELRGKFSKRLLSVIHFSSTSEAWRSELVEQVRRMV
jgi:CheY-like chemotaxis protein